MGPRGSRARRFGDPDPFGTQPAFEGVPGEPVSRGSRPLKPHLLIGCLLLSILALAGVRTGWFGPGSAGARTALYELPAACPSHTAPEVRSVADSDLAALRRRIASVAPAPVGQVYAAGSIASADLWSDDLPLGPQAPSARVPAGYELRWWALDRDGGEDDIVADVLQFANVYQAQQVLALVTDPRCHRAAAVLTPRAPAGARDVLWINPDKAPEWDAVFVRGDLLYRVVDVPPEYLLTTTGRHHDALERRWVAATVNALACALPLANCPAGAASLRETHLAHPNPLFVGGALTAPPTRGQAIAYARAVNLRSYDLSGAVQLGGEQPLHDRSYWNASARCAPALSTARAVATIRSPLFAYASRRRYEEVYSTVAVLPSDTLASRYLTALASARAEQCIAERDRTRLFLFTPSSRALHVGRFGLTRLPTPMPPSYRGTAPYRALALRIAFDIDYTTRRGRRTRLPAYAQAFVFVDGPAVVELTSVTLDRPFAQTDERFLEGLLVGRAEAADQLL